MAPPDWYYIDAEQNYVGPVDTAGLTQLFDSGFVLASTYVWAQHLDGWERYSEVGELRPAPGEAKLAVPPAALSTAPVALSSAAPTHVAPAAGSSPASPAPPSLGLALRQQSTTRPGNGLLQSLVGATPPTSPSVPTPAAASSAVQSPGTAASPAKLFSRASPASALGLTSLPSPAPATPSRTSDASGGDAASSVGPAPGARPPRTDGAPEADEPWDSSGGLRVLDASRRVRSYLGADGEVKDYEGSTLAFIEANGEVGSPAMDFLGTVHQTTGQVVDRHDEVVGEVDQGRGYVKNAQGSVVAEVTREGVVSGNGQRTAGYVQGFTFDRMYLIAAYVLLVDSDFVAGY